MLPIWSFLLSSAFSLIAFVVLAYCSGMVAGYSMLRFEAIFRPLLALALFVIYLWMLTVADQVEEHRPAAMGFPLKPGWKRQLAAGCLLGLVLTVLAVLPLAIWSNATLDISVSSGSAGRTVLVLLVLITGALGEELMFRGYPFQRLEEAIGPLGAIVVFSFLFGAVHLANPGASRLGLLNTVLIGVLLAMAYLRTRALWLPWGLHFAWNASNGLFLGLPVSGLRFFNTIARTTAQGPLWMTGGSYGLEASTPATAAVIVGLLVIWKWPVVRLSEPLTNSRPQPEHLDSMGSIQN
jgi:membrane protease YdiL (CAAX protease family)